MVITGISVAIDIIAFLAGAGSELWMFLNVMTVFYLNQRDIRELVGVTLVPVVDVPPRGRVMSPTPSPPSSAIAGADAEDLALLRRYEPILRFTHGELFFPMPAERYLESAALLAGPTAQELQVVVPAGELTRPASSPMARRTTPRSGSCASSRRP